MSPRAEFIEALFDRLTLRYGHAFLARWKDLDLQAVKTDWARELAGYADRPAIIEHALALLDPNEPPTAAHFRDLCSTAPPSFRADAQPKQAQRAAEIRRKYLRPVPPRAGRERAWATDMVQRAQAGERVSGYSLRLALDALGRSRLTQR
ncbi:hypothetical protein [Azohydromonas australica]|uniref:hypothetical protein n=1 Tax=Azohydromonas australica TaxID=364039 RepID=UPI00041ABD03|nr:hypothetical protein [Azohydromonas australica]